VPQASLNELLDRELAALGAVREALAAERTALESRDAAALLAATRAKSAALDVVAGLEAERGALAGVTGDADALARRTGKLRALTRDCRQLNDTNGALIRAQRQRVEGLLQVLAGGAARGPGTYQADGLASRQRPPRGPLATA
jgi:flagellar biosynthesis/type III secretory pathway chaperone